MECLMPFTLVTHNSFIYTIKRLTAGISPFQRYSTSPTIHRDFPSIIYNISARSNISYETRNTTVDNSCLKSELLNFLFKRKILHLGAVFVGGEKSRRILPSPASCFQCSRGAAYVTSIAHKKSRSLTS